MRRVCRLAFRSRYGSAEFSDRGRPLGHRGIKHTANVLTMPREGALQTVSAPS